MEQHTGQVNSGKSNLTFSKQKLMGNFPVCMVLVEKMQVTTVSDNDFSGEVKEYSWSAKTSNKSPADDIDPGLSTP